MQLARARYYLSLVESDINNGDYDQASDDLAKADRAILTLTGNERNEHLLTAQAFLLQGVIYYNKGNMELAEEELLDAKRILEEHTSGKAILADVLNRLGNIAHYRGKKTKALAYFQQSSTLAVKEAAYAIATRAINNMGNIYVSQGDIGKAIECYSSGLVYAEQAGPVALAQAYAILTWLHSSYGPYTMALEYAANSLTLRDQIENLDNRALVITQAGAAYLKHGDLEQAEQYLREAYILVQRTGNRIVEEQVLEELAQLVQQKDDHEAWQSYVMKAFRASSSSAFLRKESALQLTNYYIKQQDWQRAERVLHGMKDSYHQAGGTDKREGAIIAQAEALLDTAQQRWELAERHFRLALDSDTLTTYEYAQVWEQYGDMLLRWAQSRAEGGRYEGAGDALTKAAGLFRELELPKRLAVIEAKLNQISVLATGEDRAEAVIMAANVAAPTPLLLAYFLAYCH